MGEVIPLARFPDLRVELSRDLLIFQLCASAPANRQTIGKLCSQRAKEIEKILGLSNHA